MEQKELAALLRTIFHRLLPASEIKRRMVEWNDAALIAWAREQYLPKK